MKNAQAQNEKPISLEIGWICLDLNNFIIFDLFLVLVQSENI